MPTKSLHGRAIAYAEQGRGAPLVLLHGFPVDNRMWEAQIAELSAKNRVIAPDLPGFGQSQGATPFTIPSLADEMHALLMELGALPCVLAGFSMGGYIALNYVRKYPADLRGLILVDTRAEADTSEGKENRQKMIDLVRKSGAKAVAEQMEPKMLTKDTIAHRPEVTKRLRAMMEACPPQTIEYALSAMRDRPDMASELPSIPVATLIVVGDSDSITPASMAESMRQQIPRAQVAVIQGAGHMSPMEQPAQVNRAMRSYLDQLGIA